MGGGFYGRAAKLGLAGIIGQSAFLLVSPVVSRLYTPEEFGVFSPFMLAFSCAAVAATARYELAIPGPPDFRRLRVATYAALRAGAISSIVCAVVALGAIWIARPGIEMTVVYGLILPSLLLVWVVAQVGTYLASSSNDTKSLATARVSQGLALAASQVAGGLLSLGVVGLVSALSVSVVVSALCLRKVFPARVRRMRRDELKAFYSKYRRLPMFSMPAALLNAATVRAPSALLTFSYGPELGGQFLFAQTMLGGPVMLASRSLSQAIVGELSTGVGAEGARALRRTVIRGLKQMIMLGVVPSIALMLWGEEIFSLAFGEHWVGAGRICRLLALTFLTGIALVPFGQLLELLGGSRLQLIWDALRLVSVCAVLLVGYLVGWTSDATVMCYGIVLVAFYVIQVVLALRLLTEQAGLRGGTL